jgi:ethanolaminephosphotransferase
MTPKDRRGQEEDMLVERVNDDDYHVSNNRGGATSNNESFVSLSPSFIRTDSDGYYYLNKDAREQLPKYQYRGTDLSLLYHYVLSPLAGFLVDTIVPITMAPNTVTTIGLVGMISAYGIYWWYVPTLDVREANQGDDDTYPPRWIFLWNAIAMLAYQTLDNMDGKQARRTKSSSPLGLLFDHGCDAINSIFGSANWIIGMNLTPRDNMLEALAIIFGPFGLFYIATWEQYYTGELIMPILNGPNEGLLGGVLLSLTSFWMGSQFWQQTTWFDALCESSSVVPVSAVQSYVGKPLRNCDFIILTSSIMMLQEIISKSVLVTRKYKGSGQSLLPFMVLLCCSFIVGWKAPSVWLGCPRTSLHLAMILFVEMSTDIMLAHVTAQKFNPWRWQVVPLLMLTLWVVFFGSANSDVIQHFILAYTWSMAAYLTMKCALVIHEMCQVLQIWCFDIVTPHPGKKTAKVLTGTNNKKQD